MGSHPGVERGLTRPFRGCGGGQWRASQTAGHGIRVLQRNQEPSLKPSRNRYVRSLSHPDTKLNRIMLLGLQVSREQMLS